MEYQGSFLILSLGKRIDKILEIKDYHAALKKAQSKRLWKYRVFFLEKDEGLLCEIGDYLPNLDYTSRLILIRNSKTKEVDFSSLPFKKQDDSKLLNLLINYSRNLSKEKIETLKSRLNGLNLINDNEVFYRCIYHSFKMYRLRESSVELAKILLETVGVTPNNNNYQMIDQLVDSEFSDILIFLLESSINSGWSRDRNFLPNWVEDAQKIFSANVILFKSAQFLLEFSEELLEKKGVFFDETRILTWTQAGAMETWDVLGGVRTNQKYILDFKELIKKI
jgi:hypothetical protein